MKRLIFGLFILCIMIPLYGCIVIQTSDQTEFVEEIPEQECTSEVNMNLPDQIGTAEYPETVRYPKEEDFEDYEEYEQALNTWYEQSKSPDNMIYGVPENAKAFFTDSIREILTESNEENRNYSPVSLYLAVSMLAEVSDGESREELLAFLGCSSIEEVRELAGDLWLSNYTDDGITASILGNSLWLGNDRDYDQQTINLLAQYYYASSFSGEMGSSEYDQLLQKWINEQTGGLLNDQAAQETFSPETVFQLVSAIYFKDSWVETFEENMTKEETFHGVSGDVSVPFMHDSYDGPLYCGSTYASIYRNLSGGGRVWIILPDTDKTTSDVINDNDLMEMIYDPEVWENVAYYTVNLSLPKFDVTSDLELTENIRKLGVKSVFDCSKADLTPLLGENAEAAASEIHQTARFRIDENGCEAAAYTAVTAFGMVLPEYEEYDFTVDRPFIYVLTGVSGMPVFIGVVNTLN